MASSSEGGVMGYDLHITRASHWTESSSSPILLTEWIDFVDKDPEMHLDDIAIGRVKGKPAISYRNKGLAVWTAYSGHDPKGNMAWFDYHEGEIVVKNPDDEILGKMKMIASHFAACVMGDDGELY
jgi:hypothetical protein